MTCQLRESIEEQIYDLLGRGGGNNETITEYADRIAKLMDARVTELIRANSVEVVRRRVAEAKYLICQDALENIETRLGEWLTDNTENVFEEEPEIDGVRGLVDEAREACRAINPDDYGRP